MMFVSIPASRKYSIFHHYYFIITLTLKIADTEDIPVAVAHQRRTLELSMFRFIKLTKIEPLLSL